MNAPHWQAILRRRFDRAAADYGQLAKVQQASADALLANASPRGVVLDLGCGSGHLARALAREAAVTRVLAVDISEGMLRAPDWAGALPVTLQRIAGDAVSLPLATGSVDCLLSNFALHWCLDPVALMAELRRVLRSTGAAHVVIPVEGSLDNRPPASGQGSALAPLACWHAAVAASDWLIAEESLQTCQEFHASPGEWLAALRAMGVTARHDTGSGLLGRQGYQALLHRLEQTREPEGIPLSYRVWRAHLTLT